jgi:serine protease Do
MKKNSLLFLVLLLISTCATSNDSNSIVNNQNDKAPSFSEAEKNQFFIWGPSFYSSIVDIYVYSDNENIGGGTGTFISEDGLIITNQHVTVGGDKFEVFTYGTFDKITEDFIDPETNLKIEPIEAILLGSSQCNDIAVLQINTDKKNTYLEWYGDNILPGLEIYTLGYPAVADGEIAVTTGVVSYVNSLGDSPWTAPGYNTFAHTSPIFSGNSGGPVVTAEGKLVGINYLTVDLIDESFPISKALNNHHIKDLVENYLLMGENYMDIGELAQLP